MPFDRITEEALGELVQRFYAKVRDDAEIGPVFNDAIHDWDEHLVKLQAFWSSVMLTTGRYKGRPFPAHLKHADRIHDASFQRWLQLWGETAGELFVPELAGLLHEKATRIAESLSMGISIHRDGFGKQNAA